MASNGNGKRSASPAVLIPIGEVVGLTGGASFGNEGSFLRQFLRAEGVETVRDWADRVSLPVEVAASAVRAYSTHRDEVERRDREYSLYLKEHAKQVADERREESIKRQEREKTMLATSNARKRKAAEEQIARMRDRQAADDAKARKPLPPERFHGETR
ncbi:MAG: hypothetical protein WEB06_12005 [Actinomycetota bacterium]